MALKRPLRPGSHEKRKLSSALQSIKKFWRQYHKIGTGVAGLIILGAVCVVALGAPFITWYPPVKTGVTAPFLGPRADNPFGTDNLGRDIYSNVVYGARTSLAVGISAVSISLLIGIFVGALSGYFGGKIDNLLMRTTEIFLTLPRFMLALVIVAIFAQNVYNIIFAIGIVSWPATARLLRAEFLSLKEREFVDAARVLGARDRDIIFTEILPNAVSPVIVNSTLEMSSAILTEAGLSFLGVGDPNVASWGLLLSNAQNYLRTAWWMAAFPGMMLFLTSLSLNLVGDELSDWLNPRLKER